MKTIRRRFRAAVLMGAAASVLVFAAGAKAQNQNSNNNQWLRLTGWSDGNWVPNDNPWPYNEGSSRPCWRWLATSPASQARKSSGEKAGENCGGDTAQNLWSQSQAATANQIENMKPDLVALVGDVQYQVGQYSDFENSYDLTYGAFKMITRPAPGNHEFYDEHGAIGVAGYGYFSYFNGVQHNTDGTVSRLRSPTTHDTGGYLHPTRAVFEMDRRGTSSRRADSEPTTGRRPSRGRRWLVFL